MRSIAYGLNFSVFMSKVTSRKLMTFLFASMVTLRLLYMNTLRICFLILSVSFGITIVMASPSSLYRPISMLRNCCSCGRR